jgi:hypothetical protein
MIDLTANALAKAHLPFAVSRLTVHPPAGGPLKKQKLHFT